MTLSKEDTIAIARDFDVKFIRLQFVDFLGVPKNVAISIDQLGRALDGDITFDGFSVKGYNDNQTGQMHLMPDPDSFVILPWRPKQGQVGRLICDVQTSDRQPAEGCSRFVLKKAIAQAESLGYTMNAGAEAEFFLFLTDSKGNPTTVTHDKAGYFDMSPVDLGENARREMVLTLEQIGFEVEFAHHEVAEGQHEINFKYSDALDMADKIMTFRTVIKVIANRYGLHATFMPKPISGIDGSGMHTHQSLFTNGKNAFWDPSAPFQLSQQALYYIGGLLKHAKAITAITNSTINSYKRIVPGYEAPVYIAWSMKNHSAIVRIPEKREQSTRLELRSPDAACNPYLALAVMLGAGLEGIRNKIQPPDPVLENIDHMTDKAKRLAGIEALPKSLEDALRYLEQDDIIQSVLGPYITNQILQTKRQEAKQYQLAVHQWEREQYLYKY